MHRKTVCLIGGTGSIGRHVVENLVVSGHSVTVYHRGETEPVLPQQVRHVRSAKAAIPVLDFPPDLSADVVIHMTPMGEADARAAAERFSRKVERILWIGSGDVYLAYGRFTGLEPGPVDNTLLTEESPFRTVLYPYRHLAHQVDELSHSYEKILMERVARSDAQTPFTILRLPKVYGPHRNADLATVYGFRKYPDWRWTHGYVENVAAAIALAALHPAGANRIYNVGEAYTPTVAERLAVLPGSSLPDASLTANFEQNIAYDTTRNRRELGYQEPVAETECMRRTLSTRTLP